MTWTEGLVVLGVLVGFVYLIMAKVNSRNPALIQKIKLWMASTPDKTGESNEDSERSQQLYLEKRQIM